jgi:transposase
MESCKTLKKFVSYITIPPKSQAEKKLHETSTAAQETTISPGKPYQYPSEKLED